MSSEARIDIFSKNKEQHKINPFIFGNFVEDIRDHMEAMLAYVLKNMDFEEEPSGMDRVSGSWYPVTNGRNTEYTLDPPAPKHSGHSQKIKIFSDDECYAGIARKVSVRGQKKYNMKWIARACIEIKYATVELIDLSNQKKLCSKQIDMVSHDWQEYEIELTAISDCSNAELRIWISSENESWKDSVATGALWLDHVSMLPADHVDVVKKEVFEMTRDMNCGMMRIGGNYISAYHWEHGVGPQLERPNIINEAWKVMADKYFGTDEFLRFCNGLGVEPLICVNDGSGTSEEAARWVEYCNGDINTEMGRLRAENGRAEPYGVTYWEIGNEVWGPWQVGHCTAEEFAHRYISFVKAMKAVDPSIKILACGHSDLEWNRQVLEIAGADMDYLTMHIYLGYNRFGFLNGDTDREEKYKAMVSFPEITRGIIEKTESHMLSNAKYKHIKLAITEHNTMYYPNTVRKGIPNEHSLEAAVANAGNLNEMIRKSHIIEIGSFSDLVNGWLGGCIRVGDFYADQFRGKVPGWSGKSRVVYGTPTYHILKMYANRNISHLIKSDVKCEKYSVHSHKSDFQLENLPVLDVVSCISDDQNTVTVFVVNRGLEDVALDLQAHEFNMDGKVTVLEMTGESIDSINDVFQPENITVDTQVIDATANGITYMLKAHSIYAFEIEHN